MGKYIAALMERHFLEENSYIYGAMNYMIGDIDETSKIFTCDNGHEYLSLNDTSVMYSEIPFCYAGAMELDTLNEKLGVSGNINDAISAYDKSCRRILYYAGSKDGKVFFVQFDKNELADAGLNALKKKESGISYEEARKELNNEQWVEEDIDEEYDYSTFPHELVELIQDIYSGGYTVEELEELKKRYEFDKNNMEGVIETIDLELDTVKNGFPKSKVRNEDGSYDDYPLAEDYFDKDYDDEEDLEDEEEVEEDTRPFDKLAVKEEIKKAVKGQDEAINRVVNTVYAKLNGDADKSMSFLCGPSGCGKTEIWRQLSKCLGRHIEIIDAGQITSSGYVGRSLSEELFKVFAHCGNDLEKAEHAIVVFDELDKKQKDGVAGSDVLDELLPVIEGCDIMIASTSKGMAREFNLNTSNMIFGATGAFSEFYDSLAKSNKSMGFNGDVNEKYKVPTETDFKQAKVMPKEFIDRSEMISINPLKKETYKDILLNSTISPLENQKKLFKKEHVDVVFTDDYVDEKCRLAEANKDSARVLAKSIKKDLAIAYDEASDLHFSSKDSRVLEVNKSMIEDPTNYVLESKDTAKILKKN